MSYYDCNGSTGLTIPQLYSLWSNSNRCWQFYDSLLFDNNNQRRYNGDNLPLVQSDMTDLFDRYLINYSITQPGDPKYYPFQDVLLKICNTYPGSCEFFLNNYCSNLSPDQASSNTGLTNFCGCFITYPEDYGLSQECQPLCHRIANIKIADGEGGYKRCQSNVCVIDQVSINASKSVTGNASFTQVCRCPAGQCKCIISNIDLYGITGQVSFNQVCDADSTCYQANVDPNQPLVQVPCPQSIEPPTSNPPSNYSWLITLVIVLVIGLLIIILVYWLR